MLSGLSPILIIDLSKQVSVPLGSLSSIPLIPPGTDSIPLPPIPIYLDEDATGLCIDTEDKNIDIETTIEGSADGKDPKANQRPIGSTVTINMSARKDSIAVTLLSAVADMILAKVISKEYSITYINGAVSVFGGLLHSFHVMQDSDNTLLKVTMQISKTTNDTKKKEGLPELEPVPEAASLESGGIAPPKPSAPLTPPLKGPPIGNQLPKQPPIKMGGTIGT